MRKTNKCPKCSGTDFIRVPDKREPWDRSHYVAINLIRDAKISLYVCTTCGYVEHWIDSLEDLGKLREKYCDK